MTLDEIMLFEDFDFNQKMVFRSDSDFYLIYVEDQIRPVGFLTSNSGVSAFAMFAFDSLHRYKDFSPLYLGLFHCHSDASNYFLNNYKQQPVFKKLTGIIKGQQPLDGSEAGTLFEALGLLPAERFFLRCLRYCVKIFLDKKKPLWRGAQTVATTFAKLGW